MEQSLDENNNAKYINELRAMLLQKKVLYFFIFQAKYK